MNFGYILGYTFEAAKRWQRLNPYKHWRNLVGAVGIEFIKAQNPKELCGMCCSRKSFVVLSSELLLPPDCPRVFVSNFTQFFSQAKSFERLCYSPLAVPVTLCAYRCSS